jgi:hypothetical protein
VRVELAAPRERQQRTDGAARVRRTGEEHEVGSGPDSLRRPALDRCVVDERERIGDRDAEEAERAEQAVRPRLERCTEPAEAPVERVAHHHAADARPDRGAEGA